MNEKTIPNTGPSKLENQVIRIISHHSGWKANNIFRASRLKSDLRIMGDDILAIVNTMQTELGIDFSSMDFEQYFHERGEFFLMRFFKLKRENHRKAFPVTVDHLINVAESGNWFPPPQARKL
jgi:hypothetical protein